MATLLHQSGQTTRKPNDSRQSSYPRTCHIPWTRQPAGLRARGRHTSSPARVVAVHYAASTGSPRAVRPRRLCWRSPMYTPKMSSRLAVEALGTFWLVFIGCGSAIFDAKFVVRSLSDPAPVQLGIGHLGVGIAFGLAITTMAYAVGHVSGAHFNPAVTIGVAVAKRFGWREVPAYVGAQLIGGLLAGGALAGLLSSTGRPVIGNLAANGYGAHSPGGFALGGVLLVEELVNAFF